jgi:hypothetical protein
MEFAHLTAAPILEPRNLKLIAALLQAAMH